MQTSSACRNRSLPFVISTVACAVVLAFSGCSDQRQADSGSTSQGSTAPAARASKSTWDNPTLPNPVLRKATLWLGPHEINVEVAMTALEVATGMMFRESLPENSGMLFAFSRPRTVAFYMKNTTVPLSAAYINSEGKVVEIHDLEPLDEESIPSKEDNIQFVLEMNQGWFEKNGIGTGTLITTDKGTLATQIASGNYFR